MADTTNWRDLVAVLRSVTPSGKLPENGDSNASMTAVLANLLERREQTRPCPTCGTERPAHFYWRITEAGRLLMEAADEVDPVHDDA